MSRSRTVKKVGKDGQVLARELGRIISHHRRYDGMDIAIANGLLERFDIRPKEVSNDLHKGHKAHSTTLSTGRVKTCSLSVVGRVAEF